MIREIVAFAFRERHLFEVIRIIPMGVETIREQWLAKRMELKTLILSILQKGMDTGLFMDTEFPMPY